MSTPKPSRSAQKPKEKGTSEKAAKRLKWDSLSDAVLTDAAHHLVHLSSKIVNSNAAAAGVRLSNPPAPDMPYVAISTLGADQVPLDYFRGAKDSPAARQIVTVVAGQENEVFEAPDASDVARVQAAGAIVKTSRVHAGQRVDPRLRQVLVPDAESPTGWVSLSPLQSGGFSQLLRDRLEIEWQLLKAAPKEDKWYPRRQAVCGIGGAKPQNISMHGFSMRSVMSFEAPQEDPAVRRVFAIYHRGLGGILNRQFANDFAQWRHAHMVRNGGAMPSDARLREEERGHVVAMARAAAQAAEQARAVLKAHERLLPGLISPHVNAVERGLIDESQRDRDFPEIFAKALISAIERHAYRVGRDRFTVGQSGDLSALQADIEEVVR